MSKKDGRFFAKVKKMATFAAIIVRGVAQPGSVSVWGAGGRKFKSCHPDNLKIKGLGLIA